MKRQISDSRVASKLLIVTTTLLSLSACSQHREEQSHAIPESLTAEQRLILQFEKQAECEAHSPCFYACVDGALMRDPHEALRVSQKSLQMFDSVNVPAGLPSGTRDKLTRFRDLLKEDTQSFVTDAQNEIKRVSNPPKQTAGFSIYVPPFTPHNTCAAYAIIQQVNRQYKLTGMMGRNYISCEAIDKALSR